MNNLGLLYNKQYFEGLSFETNGNVSFLSSKVMDDVQNFKVKKQEEELSINAPHCFKLRMMYPGLLYGSGYNHEIGGQDNEFKLGFYFDYTTGLPVINGSSIKGMLKAGCESREGYITDILTKRLKLKLPDGFNEKQFIETVFVGKNTSIYERDIFFEAIPLPCNNKLLGNDYITHHEHRLKNPNPVQFLRVNGNIPYLFQFDLKNNDEIIADHKLELFKQMILDLGLGAKTNVGYGQFEEI